jgi:hypothetical protein
MSFFGMTIRDAGVELSLNQSGVYIELCRLKDETLIL